LIRLFVVAAVGLYREGLAQVLAREPGMTVVGTAADEDELLATVEKTKPDLVLIDVESPGGLEAVEAVAQVLPELKAIALAVNETEEGILACAEAGAAGFVLRGASLDVLITTIDSVARGEMPCSPRIVSALLRRVAALASLHRSEEASARLTTREREIVELIDAGLSNKEIAARLHIEVPTVKNHVHNILEKLNVSRRIEAAAQLRRSRVRQIA
jgi:two-component system, NarL family, nitrate/nitrite response regulator NarL